MTKLRFLFALMAALVMALAVTACGGDDDGGEDSADADPAEVLEATFGDSHEVSSGVFGMTMSFDVPGEQGGTGEMTITAPFNNNGEGEVPDVDLSVEVNADAAGESFDFEAGGTITADGATINFDGTDYEVPPEFFEGFLDGFTQATEEAEESQPTLDVDPESWFSELTNEGTEEIDGTDTVHVSGSPDIVAIGEDVLRAVDEAGIPGTELPPGFDPSQLAFVEGFIEEASFDVYSEEEGNLLRRADFTMALQNLGMAGEGAPDSAAFEVSVTMDEPNEEQEIELPDDAEPFAELEPALREEFGDIFGDLEALGAIPGADGLGGSGPKGGGAAGEVPGVSQEYLDCFEKAETPEALSKCAEDL